MTPSIRRAFTAAVYEFATHTDVMASTGHELQHAVEALSEPGITDSVRLDNFFGRLAPTDNTRFETKAGIYVGNLVREELRAR